LSRARNGLLRYGMMDAYFGRNLTERMRRLSLCKGYLRVGEEDVDGTRRRTSLPKVLEDG